MAGPLRQSAVMHMVRNDALNMPESRASHDECIRQLKARVRDPRTELAPTAQRLLAGARKVVLEKGFGGLTLSNISKASQENVASVKYYFGNKAGLVSALLDTVIFDQVSALSNLQETAPAGTAVGTLAADTAAMNRPIPAQRILFAVLSHALQDRQLLKQLRAYYRTFFELHLEQVGRAEGLDPDQRSNLHGLATLLSAIGDGLSIQALVAPDCFDIDETLATLDVLLQRGLPALVQARPSEDPK